MNWKTAIVDSVKIKANLNEDGFLAAEDETAKGYKYITLNGLKHDLSHDEAMSVFNALYTNIGLAVLDPKSAEITSTRGVA